MKKLLITALTVMMFHACATKTVVCTDGAKAQLYVDSHNNMSAVYLDKTPYYLFIEAGTGKYIYRLSHTGASVTWRRFTESKSN